MIKVEQIESIIESTKNRDEIVRLVNDLIKDKPGYGMVFDYVDNVINLIVIKNHYGYFSSSGVNGSATEFITIDFSDSDNVDVSDHQNEEKFDEFMRHYDGSWDDRFDPFSCYR